MTSFLTNARFAETGEVLGVDAGLAAADEEDGEGAARGETLGVRTVVKIARDIASPPPRHNHRQGLLLKNAPSIKGSNQLRSTAAQGETLALWAIWFDRGIASGLERLEGVAQLLKRDFQRFDAHAVALEADDQLASTGFDGKRP
jgi:hypothetical protein